MTVTKRRPLSFRHRFGKPIRGPITTRHDGLPTTVTRGPSHPVAPPRFSTKPPGGNAANHSKPGTARTETTRAETAQPLRWQKPTPLLFHSDTLGLRHHTATAGTKPRTKTNGVGFATNDYRATTQRLNNSVTTRKGKSGFFPRTAIIANHSSPKPVNTITAHDLDCLEFLATVRKARTDQIARRFFWSERTTQRRLAWLNHHGLTVCYVVGMDDHVHHLTRRGLKLLEDHRAGESPRVADHFKPSSHGDESWSHMRGMTELITMFYRSATSRGDRVLAVERRHYGGRELTYGHKGKLKPDATLLYQDGATTNLTWYALEYQCYSHRTKVLDKYAGYRKWLKDTGFDFVADLFRRFGSNQHPRIRILWVAGDVHTPTAIPQRLLNLFTLSVEETRHLRDLMWFTSALTLDVHASDPDPLSARVWLRAKDINWLTAYTRNGRRPQGPGRNYTKQTAFVKDRLPSHPLHSLTNPHS